MTDQIIHFTFYLLFFGLFFYYAARHIYLNKRRKIAFSIFIGFVLSVIVALFDQHLPTYRQGESMNLAGSFIFNDRIERSLEFVRKNMTFIDINDDSDSLLYKDPKTGEEVKLTDRKKLADFIYMLDSMPEFKGILVIDVAFDINTIHDTTLKKAIESFIDSKRLVLASSPAMIPVDSLTFADSLYGDITDKPYNKKCFNHDLVKEHGAISLPFRVYTLVNGIKNISPIPFLGFTGLKIMQSENSRSVFIDHLLEFNSIPYDSLDISENMQNDKEISLSGVSTTSTVSPIIVYDLGSAIGDNRELFRYDTQIKNKGQSNNIIIVGSFKKSGRDSHETFQNEVLQGSLILAALIENLLNTKAMEVIRFWGLLFLCFTIISLFVTFQSFKTSNEPKQGTGIRYFIKKLFKIVFFGEIHFFLLFAMMIFILSSSGRLVNIISLFLFFVVMELVFKSWGNRMKK